MAPMMEPRAQPMGVRKEKQTASQTSMGAQSPYLLAYWMADPIAHWSVAVKANGMALTTEKPRAELKDGWKEMQKVR